MFTRMHIRTSYGHGPKHVTEEEGEEVRLREASRYHGACTNHHDARSERRLQYDRRGVSDNGECTSGNVIKRGVRRVPVGHT